MLSHQPRLILWFTYRLTLLENCFVATCLWWFVCNVYFLELVPDAISVLVKDGYFFEVFGSLIMPPYVGSILSDVLIPCRSDTYCRCNKAKEYCQPRENKDVNDMFGGYSVWIVTNLRLLCKLVIQVSFCARVLLCYVAANQCFFEWVYYWWEFLFSKL